LAHPPSQDDGAFVVNASTPGGMLVVNARSQQLSDADVAQAVSLE
jgi:hypothetical protein